MGVVNPIWLWGLTGLALPIAIHLLSRKDVRVIRIGSLRHLENAITRQAIRIRLHAYGLLALRCLIVALTTLLLAGLYITTNTTEIRWLLIESGLGQSAHWRNVIDSLQAEGYETRSLEPGFPTLTEGAPRRPAPDYWTLSDQLSRMQLDRCVVISRSRRSGFTGFRPPLGANITWLSEAGDSARFVLVSRQSDGDSVVARVGRTNGTATAYQTLRIPEAEQRATLEMWNDTTSLENDGYNRQHNSSGANENNIIANNALPPVRVVIAGSSAAFEEKRVITAALKAINGNGIVPVQFTIAEPGKPMEGDWLIWLSADEPPATSIPRVIRKSRTTIAAGSNTNDIEAPVITVDVMAPGIRGADGSAAVDAHPSATAGYKKSWLITRPLTASNALVGQLTLQLATLLLDDATQKLLRDERRHDHNLMPDSEIFSNTVASNQKPATTEQRDAGDMLAVVIVLLAALERYVANRQQL